jgi:formylglycine-generating enzyme required for sulfatase activity
MKTILLFTVLTITTIVNSQIVENKGIDGMIKIGNIYVDKYEAPNAPGESPFVMFSYLEAQNWCVDRGKRLLFDDEWEMIASGPLLLPYVYGTSYNSLICNDSKLWRAPNQTLINLWPIGISNLNKISSFSGLIDSVKNISTNAAQSADHVMFLYQGESAGVNSNCFSYYGVFDLNGNVAEWTSRRDGGITNFHGNIKGGYWSQARTIQSNITTHGDSYRDYQTGFRCAKDSLILEDHLIGDSSPTEVYPNPTSQYIIFSINGNKVSKANLKSEPFYLNISWLISGIYLIKVTESSGRSCYFKVIKY